MLVPTYIIFLFIFHLKIVTSYTNECVLPNTCTSVSDYYWRDYVGIVPPDAIKGGQDEAGNTTYIGQILPPDSKGILTAVIYPGKREAVSAAGQKKFTDSKYVKILCSSEKDKFEWRSINVKEMHLLSDFNLVLGGFESELPLYVGRAYFEGELLIGKVFDDTHWARGIRLPMKNGGEQGFLSFEILVYPKCVIPDLTNPLKPDYYWRDYRGIIPHDAIEGGQDEVGNTTYIGRIVSSSSTGVLPAIIYSGKRAAVGSATGTKISSSRYVQILCSPQKKRFEWKQVSLETIQLLTDYHLVVGGVEADCILYIGRANNEDELKVGKVFDNNSKYRGLKLPLRDGSEYTLFSFEILTYPRFLLE